MQDSMGSDLSVVNAARVSFANKHRKLQGDKDEKLIKYLAKHGHWSPFAHCTMQFHIVAPIFVARQLVKHQVGLAWNEVSRRYVDTEVEFYMPKEWRARPDKSIKQGSAEEIVNINPRGDLVESLSACMQTSKIFIRTTIKRRCSTRDGKNGTTTKYYDRVVLDRFIICFCKSM